MSRARRWRRLIDESVARRPTSPSQPAFPALSGEEVSRWLSRGGELMSSWAGPTSMILHSRIDVVSGSILTSRAVVVLGGQGLVGWRPHFWHFSCSLWHHLRSTVWMQESQHGLPSVRRIGLAGVALGVPPLLLIADGSPLDFSTWSPPFFGLGVATLWIFTVSLAWAVPFPRLCSGYLAVAVGAPRWSRTP